jgi:hypothetical protein
MIAIIQSVCLAIMIAVTIATRNATCGAITLIAILCVYASCKIEEHNEKVRREQDRQLS